MTFIENHSKKQIPKKSAEKNQDSHSMGSEKHVYSKKSAGKSRAQINALGKSAKQILRIMKDSPGVTIDRLSDFLSITTRGVEKNLSKLKAKGLIERIGPNKGGHWKTNL